MLVLTLAALAVAQDAPTPEPAPEATPDGLEQLSLARAEVATWVHRFDLPACDRVKALFHDTRPPAERQPEKVVVTLHNTSGAMCLYRGLVLRGSLAGVYASSLRNPEGTGFFVPPGGELSFRVKPTAPDPTMAAIELQIPPGSGTIILTGLGPDQAPPPPP